MRQMIEIIQQRKTEQARFEARIVEWQTKNFAVALSALAQSNDQVKALGKMIKAMKLPLADEDETDTRSIEEVIEQGALVDFDAQPSFEQLSAALGNMG